jgi:hypothetical protein
MGRHRTRRKRDKFVPFWDVPPVVIVNNEDPICTSYSACATPIHLNNSDRGPKYNDLGKDAIGEAWFRHETPEERARLAGEFVEAIRSVALPVIFRCVIGRILLLFQQEEPPVYDIYFDQSIDVEKLVGGQPLRITLFSMPVGARNGAFIFKAGLKLGGIHQHAHWALIPCTGPLILGPATAPAPTFVPELSPEHIAHTFPPQMEEMDDACAV